MSVQNIQTLNKQPITFSLAHKKEKIPVKHLTCLDSLYNKQFEATFNYHKATYRAKFT